MTRLLAQSSDVTGAILTSLLLIGLTIAGFFVVVMVRRKMRDMTTEGTAVGFTLADLRALHKSGKMTDQEFERAKGRLIAEAKARSEKQTASTIEGGFTSHPKAHLRQPNESQSSPQESADGQSGAGDSPGSGSQGSGSEGGGSNGGGGD